MQIGIVGLGRMGGNIMRAGHACVVFSETAKSREAIAQEGATPTQSLAELTMSAIAAMELVRR